MIEGASPRFGVWIEDIAALTDQGAKRPTLVTHEPVTAV